MKNKIQVKIRGEKDCFPLIPNKNVRIDRLESIYFDILKNKSFHVFIIFF